MTPAGVRNRAAALWQSPARWAPDVLEPRYLQFFEH